MPGSMETLNDWLARAEQLHPKNIELDQWLKKPGWEALVNRRGTTWRKLDEAERNAVVDAPSARAALLANPSLIKRPVVNWGAKTGVTTGFDAQAWAAAVNAV